MNTRLAIAILTLTMSTACEDGDQGETGPQGNANVESSTCTWLSQDFTGTGVREHICSAPNITADIADHGAVLGFLHVGFDWIQLPTFLVLDASAGTTMEFRPSFAIGNYMVQAVEIGGNDEVSNTELNGFNGGTYELKVVAIADAGMRTPDELNAIGSEALSK